MVNLDRDDKLETLEEDLKDTPLWMLEAFECDFDYFLEGEQRKKALDIVDKLISEKYREKHYETC